MTHRYETSLFIFRRDLRLHDNTALNAALRCSRTVLPCFIFDPRQIEPHPYQSQPGLSFLHDSLADLQAQLKTNGAELTLFHGQPETIIEALHGSVNLQAVFVNRDYTPFSRRRDHQMAETCKKLAIPLHYLADALLTEPEQAVKSNRTPYKVFTAFFNHARQIPVALPEPLINTNFLPAPKPSTLNTSLELIAAHQQSTKSAHTHLIKAGRSGALSLLATLAKFSDYQNQRDFPALAATTQFSTHLKFGTCSVREVFYALTEQLGSEHPLIRQLYWRDFFTHIAYHFPQVFGHAFLEKFEHLPWDNNQTLFDAWRYGKTGFPIVDAGMRELLATGFMHNRVRMITASFLVKDLHIDWRWGERHFAQHLLDYDPCVNNGNWQWAASTGCDAQPYFRIFNPWLQQQKFDPDCQYIHRWLPETAKITAKILHQWDKKHYHCDYPAPIINHAHESQISKQRFQHAMQQ